MDAEELCGEELRLRQAGADRLLDKRWKRGAPGELAEYYRLLRNLTTVAEFDSEVDAVIMKMTAEGARQKDIQAALNAIGPRRPPRFRGQRRCREWIRQTIRKYERRWGLREAQ